MRRLDAFLNVTVDGCYCGPNGELDFFKAMTPDPDFKRHMEAASSGESELVMGRVTYQMMASYWPTDAALESDPHMAKVMRNQKKTVFSHTLTEPTETENWKHIQVLPSLNAESLSGLKSQDGPDMTVLGSGSIVAQMVKLGALDEVMLVVAPVVLGSGKRLFQGVPETALNLLESQSFQNGLTILRYQVTH